MKLQSLAEKKAYFAKVRRRNYVASLRLEGLNAPATEKGKPRELLDRATNSNINA